MGRKKDEALQRAYVDRKQAQRRAFLRNASLCALGIAAAGGIGSYAMFGRQSRNDAATKTTAAAETPRTPPASYIPLDQFTHPDAAEVVIGRSGEKPIIHIPWLHVLTTTTGNAILKKHMDVIGQVSRLALALHDQCGIDGLVSEGLKEADAKKIQRGGRVVDALAEKRDAWSDAYDTLLHARQWKLYGTDGEDARNQQPLIKINIASYQAMQDFLTDCKKRGWLDSKEVAGAHLREMAHESTLRVFLPYTQALEAYLKEDPGAKKAYAIQCDRDKKYHDAAQRAFNDGCRGVIIITGSAHEDRIRAHCEKGSNAYAVVRPKEVPRIHYASEEESLRDWFTDLRAWGTEMEISNNGFSLTVNTGLDGFYKKIGMLPEAKAVEGMIGGKTGVGVTGNDGITPEQQENARRKTPGN
jgi:hypothetical protein